MFVVRTCFILPCVVLNMGLNKYIPNYKKMAGTGFLTRAAFKT